MWEVDPGKIYSVPFPDKPQLISSYHGGRKSQVIHKSIKLAFILRLTSLNMLGITKISPTFDTSSNYSAPLRCCLRSVLGSSPRFHHPLSRFGRQKHCQLN